MSAGAVNLKEFFLLFVSFTIHRIGSRRIG
jgi:hypothetical protein